MRANKKKKNPYLPEEEQEAVEALSYEEVALLRRKRETDGEDRSSLPHHDNSDRAYLVRFLKENKAVTVSCAIILLAILAGIIFGIFSLFSHIANRPNTSDFSVVLGDAKPYTVKYRDSVRGDVLYVDLKQIASYWGLTVSGSNKKLQFTSGHDQYLRFEDNSNIAVVNGERVEMRVKSYVEGETVSAKAILEGDRCLVPYEFLKKVVSEGAILRLDKETNTVTVKRRYNIYDGDLSTKTEMKILFSADGFSVLPQETMPKDYEYSYSIDISPYLNSITSENLLLANKQHPLGKNFAPEVVRLMCPTDGENQRLQADAASALYAMMLEMKQEGIDDVYVTSSYRDYAYQEGLYEKYVKKHMLEDGMSRSEAEVAASKYSARPGESEHQTGLCLDFTTDSIHGAVDEIFEETPAYDWLSENAYKYGFILRYPEDKVSVTGYHYEPWHYRFVDRAAATEIHFGGLCLEEYLG